MRWFPPLVTAHISALKTMPCTGKVPKFWIYVQVKLKIKLLLLLTDRGTFKNQVTHMISQVKVVRKAVGFILRKEGGGACCLDLKTRRVGVPGRRGNKEGEESGVDSSYYNDDKPHDDKPPPPPRFKLRLLL